LPKNAKKNTGSRSQPQIVILRFFLATTNTKKELTCGIKMWVSCFTGRGLSHRYINYIGCALHFSL